MGIFQTDRKTEIVAAENFARENMSSTITRLLWFELCPGLLLENTSTAHRPLMTKMGIGPQIMSPN